IYVRGSVLDGCLILRGHQGADVGQIRDEFRRLCQCVFTLFFEALVGLDRVTKFLAYVLPHPVLNAIADDEKRGCRQTSRNRQERKEKLRSQTDIAHPGFPPLVRLLGQGHFGSEETRNGLPTHSQSSIILPNGGQGERICCRMRYIAS